MKIIFLITGFLLLQNSVATAQLPDHESLTTDKLVNSTQDVIVATPLPSSQLSDEYAPLSNEPFFPGGQQALKTYFQNRRHYPCQARRAGIEGTVHVQFCVMSTGQLVGFRVVRSRGHMLDTAALKALAQMPRWYPAHRSGVAVSSMYILPISFRLNTFN